MTIPTAAHQRVCPVWIGYLLANPIRSLFQNPQEILSPQVRSGMRVMDIGSAMGFFSLPLARLVGPGGRVFSVDLQRKMLDVLIRRARRAGLAARIETRLCAADSLGVVDLAGQIDFVLLFAVLHEIPDPNRLFVEIHQVLAPKARVLFAEPRGHVDASAFERSLSIAEQNGLYRAGAPKIAWSHATVLEKR